VSVIVWFSLVIFFIIFIILPIAFFVLTVFSAALLFYGSQFNGSVPLCGLSGTREIGPKYDDDDDDDDDDVHHVTLIRPIPSHCTCRSYDNTLRLKKLGPTNFDKIVASADTV